MPGRRIHDRDAAHSSLGRGAEPAGSIDVYADYDPRIREGRAQVTATARPAGALDQLTHELVRLRNAELQGCHY